MSYSIEPHICRECFGRILSHKTYDKSGAEVTNYVCSNCETAAQGVDASVLCCCGIKLKAPGADGRPGKPSADAGIRCHANPNPTLAFPCKIVASSGIK